MSNIIISCFLAYKIGIVGVAIGTLIAMTYQTLWMMVYVSKYLLVRPTKESIVHLLLDIIVLLLSFGLTARIEMTTISYFSWGLYAAKVAGVLFFIDFVVNYLLYKYMFKTCRNNRT
jgi:Na+-driven multidrug efflux pump